MSLGNAGVASCKREVKPQMGSGPWKAQSIVILFVSAGSSCLPPLGLMAGEAAMQVRDRIQELLAPAGWALSICATCNRGGQA